MAINKKLIHFLRLADFKTRLANNEILDSSIVFIKDANKIWTHGSYYDGSTVDLTDIENSILNILDNKVDKTEVYSKSEIEAAITNKVDKVSGKGLSTNDYTAEEKNKLAGAYTKPSGGIPKTDLASAVQTSLCKADTALQSFTETDPTVPAWAKAANKPTYTAAEVGALPSTTTIPTKVSQLTNDSGFVLPSGLKSINGESIVGSGDIAIEANVQAVDTEDVVDDVNISYATLAYVDSIIGNKQNTLVSGTNIKTINGESILGSGNIEIQGDGGNAVETITPFTNAIAFLGTEQSPSMKANTIYIQGGTTNLDTLNFLEISSFEETSDVYSEYIIIFMFNNTTQGEPSIALPDYVNWANGEIPTIEANVVYELNIARSIVAGEIEYCAVLVPFKTV